MLRGERGGVTKPLSVTKLALISCSFAIMTLTSSSTSELIFSPLNPLQTQLELIGMDLRLDALRSIAVGIFHDSSDVKN